MTVPSRSRSGEVGPQGGRQNEASTIPLETEVIESLTYAGLTAIEAGSVVSGRGVPQTAQASNVQARLVAWPASSSKVSAP